MTDEPKKLAQIADLTLERVRRLETSLGEVKDRLAAQDQKLNAIIDLATGTRADFSGFMKLYAAQEQAIQSIGRQLERIQKRLDLADIDA